MLRLSLTGRRWGRAELQPAPVGLHDVLGEDTDHYGVMPYSAHFSWIAGVEQTRS